MKYSKTFLALSVVFFLAIAAGYAQAEDILLEGGSSNLLIQANPEDTDIAEDDEDVFGVPRSARTMITRKDILRWVRTRREAFIGTVLRDRSITVSSETVMPKEDAAAEPDPIGGLQTKLLKKAAAYLKEVVNPDEYELLKREKKEDIVTYTFQLQGGASIVIAVNKKTDEVWMPNKELKDTLLNTRTNIADKMGTSIEEVHINDIEKYYRAFPLPIMIGDPIEAADIELFPAPYPIFYPIGPEYKITARIGDYTLVLDYTRSYYGGPLYSPMAMPINIDDMVMPEPWLMPTFSVTLRSFIDNKTGIDYVKEAQKEIQQLLNPEFPTMSSVNYWSMEDGVLQFRMSSMQYPFYDVRRRISTGSSSPILVEVDLETGIVAIDPAMVKAVIAVREEISNNLEIAYSDVHVNRISAYMLMTYDSITSDYITVSGVYNIYASTPRFDIGYRYEDADMDDNERSLKLERLVSRETGQDLLKNATKQLEIILNPDSFKLINWGAGDDVVSFKFQLEDGSIVKINVDIETGDARMANLGLEEDIISVREGIVQNMGVAMEEVHINGVEEKLLHELPWYVIVGKTINAEIPDLKFLPQYPIPYPSGPEYKITVRVGDYTLTLDCTKPYYDYPIYSPIVTPFFDEAIQFMPERWLIPTFSFTLRSFVDNRTGVDYVKEAQKEIQQLLNSEFPTMNSVSYWTMEDGVLKLKLSPVQKRYWEYGWGYDVRDTIHIGDPSISVKIDLETGIASIAPNVVEAVTAAREEAANNLGIAYEDTHVNNIYAIPALRYYIAYDFTISDENLFMVEGYKIYVSTPQFTLGYYYDTSSTGNAGENRLKLESLVSKETGQDLFKMVIDAFGDGSTFGNPTESDLVAWNQDENGFIRFVFELDYQTQLIVVLGIDAETGEYVFLDIKEIRNGRRNHGDVNLDGVVDILDVLAIHLHVVGDEELSQEALALADVNQDGMVTALDTRIVHNYVIGAIDSMFDKQYIYGDVDFNGVVDILDVLMLYLHTIGDKELSAEGLIVADINDDGKVDESDQMNLYLYVIGDSSVPEIPIVALPEKLSGDVNFDGQITLEDAFLVGQHLKGLKELSPEALIEADVNGDGEVDKSDAKSILQDCGEIKADKDKVLFYYEGETRGKFGTVRFSTEMSTGDIYAYFLLLDCVPTTINYDLNIWTFTFGEDQSTLETLAEIAGYEKVMYVLPSAPARELGTNITSGKVLAKFNESVTMEEIDTILDGLGAVIESERDLGGGISVTIRFDHHETTVNEMIDKLLDTGKMVYAEPNGTYHTTLTSDALTTTSTDNAKDGELELIGVENTDFTIVDESLYASTSTQQQNILNSDVLQMKAVEEEVQAQANDPLFTGEMIVESTVLSGRLQTQRDSQE